MDSPSPIYHFSKAVFFIYLFIYLLKTSSNVDHFDEKFSIFCCIVMSIFYKLF